MISIKNKDIKATCFEFARTFLCHLSRYDLQELNVLIDFTFEDCPLEILIPRPNGFTYDEPENYDDFICHFLCESDQGLEFHFEVPFKEKEFRSGYARFYMSKKAEALEITFEGIVPS